MQTHCPLLESHFWARAILVQVYFHIYYLLNSDLSSCSYPPTPLKSYGHLHLLSQVNSFPCKTILVCDTYNIYKVSIEVNCRTAESLPLEQKNSVIQQIFDPHMRQAKPWNLGIQWLTGQSPGPCGACILTREKK